MLSPKMQRGVRVNENQLIMLSDKAQHDNSMVRNAYIFISILRTYLRFSHLPCHKRMKYENVEKKNYPNMLVLTGLHDSQVQYFEPAKWVAKLRATKTDSNHLFLRTNMDFGHGGASGRFDYLKEVALKYAFMFSLEGIEK